MSSDGWYDFNDPFALSFVEYSSLDGPFGCKASLFERELFWPNYGLCIYLTAWVRPRTPPLRIELSSLYRSMSDLTRFFGES